ncbi:replication factor C small subunit [Paramagnetospirillum caucaseum]|uniref:Replication factor C small subunit n=1 Tax=Paramagnetospirillum caucaseum TaxID=1244869 RepID=M3A6Y7_9PROT|nr:AAA family ATPase [Paramagnetospirillum caucaseum]EME68249.1 replication factor C small subunit [Paramagnetospirillum caucaseum]
MVAFTTKYKPKCLADVVYPDTQTELDIMSYENAGRFNNIILYGTYGTGKTTIARLMPKAVVDDVDEDNEVDFINGSKVRGIQCIDDVEDFLHLTSWNKKGFKFVIIDEAEQLTKQAQFALKGVMDRFIDDAMFIFTTNHINDLYGGIQSRAEIYLLDPPPVERLVPLVKHVLKCEKLTMSDPQINQFTAKYGTSVRNLLMKLETLTINAKRKASQPPSTPNLSCNTTLNQPTPTSAAITSNPVSCNTTLNQPTPTSAATTSNPVSCNTTLNQSTPTSSKQAA